MAEEEFHAFPKERVQQVEQRVQANKPYQSPHLPEAAKARIAAANMTTSAVPVGHPNHPGAPVQAPGFTVPTSEPEGVALDLPSKYAFYDFKDLYVKPFKGLHLGKLSRAKEERSTLHVTEAVSSVLSNSRGDLHLGFQLTLPDFYYVLYWLRLNSFAKSKFIHTTTCTNEEHIERVTKGELASDTLTMSEVLTKTTLETVLLNTLPDPEEFTLEYPGFTLTPATMQTAIELTDDEDFDDPAFRFAGQLAAYIKGTTPLTLKQKVAIVEDMSLDDVQLIQRYELAIGEYGITEKVKVTCKHCNATKMDDIHIDAHSFFL